MLKRIWKYEIIPYRKTKLPVGAKILSFGGKVDDEGEHVFLWAIVDPTAVEEERDLEIYHTGDQIREGMGISREFLATVFAGEDVFHIFEYTRV